MEAKEIKIITDYVSAWGWQLTTILFVCTLIVATMLHYLIFQVALALLVAVCEFMTLKRRKEFNGNS